MTDPVLVLRLASPMQSWGVRAAFADYRDSTDHPTRSGVLGLLACALGHPRGADPGDLNQLDLTIRIDKPGTPMEDFHTVGGQSTTEVVPSADGGTRRGAILTRRAYLADAAFTVVLTGPTALLHKASDALDQPTYTPFLGRRACPPAAPYNLGIHPGGVSTALATAPLDRTTPAGKTTVTVDTITTVAHDDPTATHTLNDNPHGRRRFSQRTLARVALTLPADLCVGNDASERYERLHNYRYNHTN
ncbi:type I-E CRISPR-associated protein Cas5/CasD [Kitasatospora xanthocidica]|uniref:Type I-E CRISPR-associated protein Cas5/CasD n=1 Tax=Kitasatospora xanthocidica TaxID=83382 RepID=A0A373A3D5_9ACTN|nr:type I-E CRISPR-associated protein Cas5/CasD [Kitasatospora xanthocidica]RGD62087.1 type I-E CRISPR-associated protein Cas5/CasD [Kitasatospora xanthocidica]